MNPQFAGFPAEGLKFLRDLEKNNRREWFQPRKELYEQFVKAPMVDLVTALNAQLIRIAPEHVAEPQKAIFRIYRDTRFSKDKTPYKTHIAAHFRRRGVEKFEGASLYFSVSHKEIEVAGGLYKPGPEQLIAVRAHLAEHHEEFRKLMRAKAVRTFFGELWGEQLSRVPKDFPCDHPAQDLIRYKQWVVFAMLDPELAGSPKLLPEITSRFRAMLPMVEFLNAPLAVQRKKAARAGLFVD